MITPTGERLLSADRFTALSQFETWAKTDWLHEPGSSAAQIHARAKLDEEACELNDALKAGDPETLVSELGDVLWTASANVLNAGIN